MMEKRWSRYIHTNKIMFYSIGLAIIYWILESFIHSFFFNGGDILTCLISGEHHELWMRFLTVGIIISFGIYANREMKKRKSIEKKLKYYSNHLERIVGKRTKELEKVQEQLIRKEKLAVLGQLAGGVSHELRNPLGVIKNTTELLIKYINEPDKDIQDLLDILNKAVKRTENVVFEFLDFGISKPQVIEDVDLDVLLNEVISNIKVPDNINIHIRSLDRNIIICGDPTKLSQIFENLIINGIQAMLEGGEFTIRTKISDGNWGIVSFTDTGVGISKENLKKVFEPLFTTKASGIGLGLTISIDYIQDIGGKIEVQSVPGKGSTFDVILPISRLETQ